MTPLLQDPKLRPAICTDILTVDPDCPILDVILAMYQTQSSYALITVDQKPLGIFTERDLVAIAHQSQNLKEKPVSTVMTHPVISLSDTGEHTLFSLLTLLQNSRIRHLPITDVQGFLVGMITLNSLRKSLDPADLLQMRRVGDLNLDMPLTATLETSIAHLAHLMASQQRSCIVIVDLPTSEEPWRMDGCIPLGIITERDIVQFLALELEIQTLSAQQVMSSPLAFAFRDTTLWEVKYMMEERRIRRVVVLGEAQNLVGIVTQAALMHALDPLEMLRTIEALRASEQQKAQALRTSQASLAAAQRVARVGSWELDVEKGIFQGFEETFTIFGLNPQQITLGQADLQALIDPIDQDLWARTLDEAIHHHQCFQLDFRIHRPDGTMRYLEARGEPILDSRGRCYRLFGTLLDITARKLSALALEEREQFLRSVYEGAEVGIVIMGVDPPVLPMGAIAAESSPEQNPSPHSPEISFANLPTPLKLTYQSANPAYERLTGIREADLAGKTPADIWDLGTTQQVLQSYYRCLATGDRFTYEACHTLQGQDLCWFTTLSPLFNTEGRIDRVLATMSNITAQKKREEALQLIVEGTAGTTGQVFFQSCVFYLAKVLGVRYALVTQILPQDLSQLQVLALWQGDHWADPYRYPTAHGPSSQVFQGHICYYPEGVQQQFPQDHSLQQLQVEGYLGLPLYHSNGQILGHLAVMDTKPLTQETDRSSILKIFAARAAAELERQMIEDVLAESERQYRDLVETVDCIILRWDAAGRIRFLNDYGQRFFGFDLGEIMGRSLLDTIVPQTESSGRDLALMIQTICAEPERFRSNENENMTCTGQRVWIAWTNRPVFNEAGELLEILSIGTDITARKQAEAALETHNQLLKQANDQAEAASRIKSEFLANMSHELRTPLNAILGFSQLLVREGNLSLDQQKKLGIINNSGEHLLRLINDVLEMSKIEAGQAQLHPINSDLFALLNSLEQMFSLKADSKGLRLAVVRGAEVPRSLWIDESKLRQILINLVGNAIKFTERGSVHLRVSSVENAELLAEYQAQTPLEPDLAPPQSASLVLSFEVEDTGPGIPPEEQTQIFQSFVQSSATSSSEPGTGLGLAISQRYAQLLGGHLSVRSTLGCGTCFSLQIPVTLATGVPAMESGHPRRVKGLRANQPASRILVVEDRWENREFLVQLLLSTGFEVREASNGQEAIEIWEQWQPHLICMDMRMPVMDGYAATRHIKSHLQGQATVILALTASALEEERSLVLSAGCDDFMRKPFQEHILFEKIAHYLQVEYEWVALESTIVDQGEELESSSFETLQALLAELNPKWVTQLHEASKQADEEVILDLVAQLDDRYLTFKQVIQQWVEAFQYDRIMALTLPR